jgi:hypothetical protein
MLTKKRVTTKGIWWVLSPLLGSRLVQRCENGGMGW